MIQFRTDKEAEPAVSLDELKAHLRVTHSSEDAYIAGLINAAVEEIELATGCALARQEWRLSADEMPRFGQFEFKVWPVTSVEAVTIYDRDGNAFSLASVDWKLTNEARPAKIAVNAGARKAEAIEIDFVAGYEDAVPDLLRQAILMLCAYWYENRAALSNGTSAFPANLDRLIARFRNRRL